MKYFPKIKGERKYLFALFTDRRTRLVYIKIYDKKDKKSSKDFLEKVISFYSLKINKILSDNGKEFTYKYIKGISKIIGDHFF